MIQENRFKKRVVIKVGSNVMTNTNNRIVVPILRNLVRQIAYLYERDVMSILVSSGAAIAGKEIVNEIDENDPAIRRQIFASVGQPRLMRHYYSAFHDFGLYCAQVLATKRDFSPGIHQVNMVNCYEGLLKHGIIPIANEDDAVSLSKSMFSDNDELASLVAELTQADMLIMLTDTNGFYTGHPDHPDSRLLNEIDVDENIEHFIQKSEKGEAEGRGGMESKVKIAKRTARKNIPTYIANGKNDNIIIDILSNKKVGTLFRKID